MSTRRNRVLVVAAVAVLALAIVLWRQSTKSPIIAPAGGPTPSSSSPGATVRADAGSLTAAQRDELRARILAGNARIGGASTDATAAVGSPADAPGPIDPAASDTDATHEQRTGRPAYHEDVFAIAGKIVDDCMNEHADSGNRLEVKYIVIADDDAGGLFEDVELPAATNTSGPETLECVTERMLGSVLPPPPIDIGRFAFGVEIELFFPDARP